MYRKNIDGKHPFVKNLRALLKARGLSYKQLSAATGIHHQSITRYANGYNFPRFDEFIKLGNFFRVSLDALAGLYIARVQPKGGKKSEALKDCLGGEQPSEHGNDSPDAS